MFFSSSPTTLLAHAQATIAQELHAADVWHELSPREVRLTVADRAWPGYQHAFAGNASRADHTAADLDFDSPLMRLAAGGPPSAAAARRRLTFEQARTGRRRPPVYAGSSAGAVR